jgi:hypothetical protein
MPCRVTPEQLKRWRQERLVKEQAEEQRQARKLKQARARQAEDESRERQRVARVDSELAALKAAIAQAQCEHQRQQFFRAQQRVIDELEQSINPPPAPEQQSYMHPSDGTAHLGHVDFNPSLLSQPMRWW